MSNCDKCRSCCIFELKIRIGSVVSLDVATELAELNKHLKVVQIAKAGHGVPYDQPERFSAVVQNFLQSISTF